MPLFLLILLGVLLAPAPSLGIMLGPYTGKVIDSQTGEPIAGASVLLYWEKRIPAPPFRGESEVIAARLVYTDHKGDYEIPPVSADLGLMGYLEYTSVAIYEPGYQVWSERILHERPSRESLFREKGFLVKLDRIRPPFSHRKHYEKIDRALWGLREYGDIFSREKESSAARKKRLEMNLKIIPEREEFLRRAEWEERRDRMEGRE